METKPASKPHTATIENRSRVTLNGIEKVINSSDEAINLLTSGGGLNISGKNLKIQKFNIDDGTLVLEGTVDSLRYSVMKAPLLKRLFK